MSTIGQNSIKSDRPVSTSSAILGDAKVDDKEKAVDRGFSNQNSFSRVDGEKEATVSQGNTPSLDKPGEGAESDKATSELLQMFENEKGATLGESIKKSIDNRLQNPLGNQVATLQNHKGHLANQGFSEAQIDAMTALANPDNPDNSLASMHSSSARMKELTDAGQEGKLNTLFNTFEDVVVKFSAITDIPEDLRAELEADFENFTKTAFNAKGLLDLDSATTMLMQIQSKFQDERIKFDQEVIKAGQVSKELASNKRMEKILESIQKADEAKNASLISRIFGFIALAFMAVVTAVAFATGVGAVAGGLLIAAMALTVVMTVSSETNNFMTKVFGEGEGAQMGAMAFWSGIMIAMSLGAAAAGGVASAGSGAANAASAGTSSGATVTATATSTAGKAAAFSAKTTNMLTNLQKTGQAVQGAATVADGGASVATSVYSYEADTLRAEALEEKAVMLRIQQQIEDAIEGIQKAIEELQSGYSTVASIVKSNHDTKTTLARNLRA